MIISKTPLRISFLGGGSDLQEYYKNNHGAVISTSIDKYIYLSAHKYWKPNTYFLKYSETEEVKSVDEIQHNIIREVFRMYNILNMDFNSTADIPAGTGMGSSSSFTCGLVNLCASLNNIVLNQHEIAEIACKIEIEQLKEPIGKQDQFGCAIGGLKYIQFNSDETVDVQNINLSQSKRDELTENSLLLFTNKTRKASSILNDQKNNTITETKAVQSIDELVNLTKVLKRDLDNNNLKNFGRLLHEGWNIKKSLSKKISNSEIDDKYNQAIKLGAEGGKILGAGGGGFLYLYAPKELHSIIASKLNFRRLEFNLESSGTSIIYNQK